MYNFKIGDEVKVVNVVAGPRDYNVGDILMISNIIPVEHENIKRDMIHFEGKTFGASIADIEPVNEMRALKVQDVFKKENIGKNFGFSINGFMRGSVYTLAKNNCERLLLVDNKGTIIENNIPIADILDGEFTLLSRSWTINIRKGIKRLLDGHEVQFIVEGNLRYRIINDELMCRPVNRMNGWLKSDLKIDDLLKARKAMIEEL